MEKYKICPSCKTKNPPTVFECLNCEEDLTRVTITDEETERMLSNNKIETQEKKLVLVRICECGTKNPSNARKCSNCNEDISDIPPTLEDEVISKPITYILSSLDGQYAYKISNKETLLGRENSMSEYLNSKTYVSRLHAKLIYENNELFIENLSNTNFTYVNNIKISDKTKLNDGDEIGLGGTNINGNCQNQAAYFMVRVGECM